MLTQVGPITTNGVQQQEIAAGTGFNSAGGNPPTYPGTVPVAPATLPLVGAGVTVFSKSYRNLPIYTTNVGYEQQLVGGYAAYLGFTMSKGVHLTRFTNPNVAPTSNPNFNCGANEQLIPPGVCLPMTGDISQISNEYPGPAPFPNLGQITDTVSSAKSLWEQCANTGALGTALLPLRRGL